MSSKLLALSLAVLLAVLFVVSLCLGSTNLLTPADALQGAFATIGLAEPLADYQAIARLRLLRVATAVAVGAALALSGGLLQGVFRNDLASPGIIGVSSGASLGAALAILFIGGYGARFFPADELPSSDLLITGMACVGAILTAFLVTAMATTNGRVSVPNLLLVGIAVNAIIGGLLAAIQSFVLKDYEVAQALFTWLFGRLDDRTPFQVGLVWCGLLLAASVLPFISFELDLLAGGEEDAEGLGVDTPRVKLIAVVAASIAAATAVSVAGQIAFVGLVVPHLLRRLAGAPHRPLLVLCVLGGPVLLLGADLAQRLAFGDDRLQPGVTMSLLGGPFFLWLLVRNRRRLETW